MEAHYECGGHETSKGMKHLLETNISYKSCDNTKAKMFGFERGHPSRLELDYTLEKV